MPEAAILWVPEGKLNFMEMVAAKLQQLAEPQPSQQQHWHYGGYSAPRLFEINNLQYFVVENILLAGLVENQLEAALTAHVRDQRIDSVDYELFGCHSSYPPSGYFGAAKLDQLEELQLASIQDDSTCNSLR